MSLVIAPVAAAEWGSPTIISTEFSSQRPVVAMNAGGDVAVAWQRGIDQYNTALQLAVRPRGSTAFLPPVDVNAPDLDPDREGDQIGHNIEQAVAIGPDGSSLVVWRRGFRVLAMSVPAGAQSGPRVELAQLPVSAAYPAVGIDDGGRATAVWLENDTLVAAVRHPGSAGFGPVQHVVELDSPHRYDIGIGTGGTTAIAWRYDDIIHAVVRDGDGPWIPAAPIALSPELTNFGEIDVSVGPRGDVILAWAEQVGAQGHIRAAVRPAGGSFAPPERLADVFFTGVYETNTAVDQAGNAIVTWVGGSRNPDLEAGATARYRPAGASWGPPEPVAAVNGAEEAPAVTFDAAGTAFAAWRLYDDHSALIGRAYASARPAGGTFGAVTPLVPGDANVWVPAIAAHAPGKAVVVYNRGTFPWWFHIEAVDHLMDTEVPPSEGTPQAQDAPASRSASYPPAHTTPLVARPNARRFAAVATAGVRGRRVRTGVVRVRIIPPGTARVRFTLEYRDRRWRTAGSTARSLTESRPISLRFVLSPRARRALERTPARPLRVRASIAPGGR